MLETDKEKKLDSLEVVPVLGAEDKLSELSKLLQEQLSASEAILQEVANIKGHIRWQRIWSTLRFFLIVVPIALGFIYGLLYFPPEVKEAIDYYQSLFRF